MKMSPEHQAWRNMNQRCYYEKDKKYKFYGGRGITVCDEWRNNSKAFIAYMGPRPSKDHSIDRIDNNKGYEPGNVRWATREEQMRNRRNGKAGRPKSNRRPILVRLDSKVIKLLDYEIKKPGSLFSTRPEVIRFIVRYYFNKQFMGLNP